MSDKLKRALLYGVLGFVGALLFVAGSAAYTSRSSFCITCHYMQPFYDSWKASTHRNVECAECHFAPGIKNTVHGKMMGLVQLVKYATSAYKKSRPWAEIPDESCLRKGCHETRLLTGKVMFKEGVMFDHQPHLTELKRGKKLRCTSCHSQIVQGNHMKVTETTCFLCHFKREDGAVPITTDCLLCHTRETMLRNSRAGLMRYDHTRVIQSGLSCVECHADTVSGRGAVNRENCFGCHWDNERLGKFGDTTLIHTNHISKNKIECMRCHTTVEHRINAKGAGSVAECASCHPTHHSEMISLFTGTGGKGAKPHPNKMLDIGLNCRGCHISHGVETDGKSGKTYVADTKACDHCHGRGFMEVIRNWQSAAKADVAELWRAAATLKAALRHAPDKARAEATTLLKDAEHNIDIVQRGNIVHNVKYANDLLVAAGVMLQGGAKALNISLKTPAVTQRVKKPYAECITCHFYIEKITPQFAGLDYSHKNHLDRGLECQRCHSIAKKHGEMILDRDKCAPCHHRESVKKACVDCHKLQTAILKGKWDTLAEPGPMSDEFPCTDCHTEKARRVTPADCVKCHEDEGYAETLKKWNAETASALAELEEGIARLDKITLEGANAETAKRIKAFAQGIRDDASGGAHNPHAIKKALREYLKQLAALPRPPS